MIKQSFIDRRRPLTKTPGARWVPTSNRKQKHGRLIPTPCRRHLRTNESQPTYSQTFGRPRNFHPSVRTKICRVCGKSVDIRSDEWNESLQDPCHRFCANQPDPTERVWKTRRSKMTDRADAKMITRVLEKPEVYVLKDDKRHELAQILYDIATTSMDLRAKMVAATGLMKLGIDIDKNHLEREKFEDNRQRLDSGLPTEITSDPARFQLEARSLLLSIAGESESDETRESGIAGQSDGVPQVSPEDKD